jgi:hypothetical protein
VIKFGVIQGLDVPRGRLGDPSDLAITTVGTVEHVTCGVKACCEPKH